MGIKNTTAAALSTTTADAYSFRSYGAAAWTASCRMLLRRGFNGIEVDAIMRSILTRFAADDRRGARATSADLARLLDRYSDFDGLTLQEYVDATVLAIQTEHDAPVQPPTCRGLRLVWSRS